MNEPSCLVPLQLTTPEFWVSVYNLPGDGSYTKRLLELSPAFGGGEPGAGRRGVSQHGGRSTEAGDLSEVLH